MTHFLTIFREFKLLNLLDFTSKRKRCILIKHKSKLEKEVEEAKKNSGKMFVNDHMIAKGSNNSSEDLPDLGSVLNKKMSLNLRKKLKRPKRSWVNYMSQMARKTKESKIDLLARLNELVLNFEQ